MVYNCWQYFTMDSNYYTVSGEFLKYKVLRLGIIGPILENKVSDSIVVYPTVNQIILKSKI